MDTKDIGIALSGIISNGNLIKQGIKFIPPPVGVWRTYKSMNSKIINFSKRGRIVH